MGKVRDVGIHTLNHPAATAFFAEEIVVKCEVKPDEDIYIYKGIQTKSNCQDIYYAHFAKPEIFFKSFECLKLLRRNHYKKSEEWNLLKTAL